jgi:uncharacterized membrane protein
MSAQNLALYVASYADADAASSDYQALQQAEGDDLVLLGSVVLSADADGTVTVTEHGGGEVAGGALLGGGAGLIVGLFAPPLLLATGIGAAVGAVVGEFTKKHEEKQLGVELEEYLPPSSSAIVAVLDDQYLDGIDDALTRSDKKVNKAIDSGDYDKLKKAFDESGDDIAEAVGS